VQARITLPEFVKPGVKPEIERRSEKKPETGFLSFVMQAVAQQPAGLEASPIPAPAPLSSSENPSLSSSTSGLAAKEAADTASQAARNDELAERVDREVKETKEKHETSRSEERPAEGDRAGATDKENKEATRAAADAARRPEVRPEVRSRTVETRLHAAFDLRPVSQAADRVDAAFGKLRKQELSSLHRSPVAGQDKISQADKSFVAGAGVEPSRASSVKQSRRPEEQLRVALELRPDVLEPVKKQETKERHVAVSVNPEKWSIEHEKRDFKDFRGSAQGDRRELVRELRDTKTVRVQAPVENRETGFAELLKSAPLQPEQKKVLSEVKETFSKLVERARVNIAADGTSTASMRLKPEQLGNVTLNLRVAGSQVEAKLVVESEHVKKMMKEEIEQLAVELKRQGFSVDAIEIRVREPSEGSLSFAPDHNARNEDPRSASNSLDLQPMRASSENYEYGAEAAEPVWEGSVNLAV
jgi:flagellar hook-length control protein FliK